MACMGKKEHDNLEDMNEVTGERSGFEEARVRSLGFRLRAGRSAALSAQILIQIAGGKD